MSSRATAKNPSSRVTDSLKQRYRAQKRQKSLLLLKPVPTTRQIANDEHPGSSQQHLTPTSRIPLEEVSKCKDLWFNDGDVIIWVEGKHDSLLFRVHRHVLRKSRAEPFCTAVECDYPNPERSNDTFLNGAWVLKYDGQDPTEITHVIKWMYERPSISKRSTIPFAALETYLVRSDEYFIPDMRRCALEYLWNMLPTSLNYHQRVPTFVQGCYSGDPILFYKPHVVLSLVALAKQHRLMVILPLLCYYIAQWPVDWITDGVPAASMGFDLPPNDSPSRLPRSLVIIILAGREKLIRMRETKVFNFMEAFTLSGTTVDVPIEGCDGKERPETGETCFHWLMRVWFYMGCLGLIACPAALDIMNMGQWTELKKYCCEACAKMVIEHMLTGRDAVWDALPSVFGYCDWAYVIEQQKNTEERFETESSY